MSCVLRAVRKRKKVRRLGAVDIIRREAYADLELDAKVELIRALVPLGLLHVQELLDQEVTALAGARYARKDESVEGRRHGSNPGTVGLAGQRVPIRVPRIRHVVGSEIPLRSYEAMRGDQVMVVAVTTGQTFSAETPAPLFAAPYPLDTAGAGGTPNYDIAPDGEQFIFVEQNSSTGGEGSAQIHVVLNWHQELTTRVPVP